jgi:hypothetical protein
MDGKKDSAVVVVITNVTQKQATDILGDVVLAKSKRAPLSRGTAVTGNRKDVSKMLGDGRDKLTLGPSTGKGGKDGNAKQLSPGRAAGR